MTPKPQALGGWGGEKVQFLKGKVLVRWLRRLEVLQLFPAWDVRDRHREDRNLKPGGMGVGWRREHSKAFRVV